MYFDSEYEIKMCNQIPNKEDQALRLSVKIEASRCCLFLFCNPSQFSLYFPNISGRLDKLDDIEDRQDQPS